MKILLPGLKSFWKLVDGMGSSIRAIEFFKTNSKKYFFMTFQCEKNLKVTNLYPIHLHLQVNLFLRNWFAETRPHPQTQDQVVLSIGQLKEVQMIWTNKIG